MTALGLTRGVEAEAEGLAVGWHLQPWGGGVPVFPVSTAKSEG